MFAVLMHRDISAKPNFKTSLSKLLFDVLLLHINRVHEKSENRTDESIEVYQSLNVSYSRNCTNSLRGDEMSRPLYTIFS